MKLKFYLSLFLMFFITHSLSASNIINANDTNFADVKRGKAVIVEFYQKNCGACQKFKPIYEQVSNELGSELSFVKVDVKLNRYTGKQYGVSRTPTLVVFKNGQEVSRYQGSLSQFGLKKFIENSLYHQ